MPAENQPTPSQRITIRCPSCHRWNRVEASRAAAGPKCGACAAPMPLDHPVALDDESFERTVRESTVPVLVDFYADWCGPCKAMAPFVEQLAARNVGRALVAKLNTDEAQRTAAGFRISGIPTVIVFKGGTQAARQSGAMPLPALQALLDRGAA